MFRPRALGVAVFVLLAAFQGAVPAAEGQEGRPQGWLGASLVPVNAPEKGNDSPVPGVLVRGLVEGGPAETAGLRSRDVILTIDGGAIASPAELVSRIQGLEPGAWASLHVRRGRRELDLDAHLQTRPSDLGSLPMVSGHIGAVAIDIPPALREHFGAPREAGAMVSMIEPGSTAEAAGLDLGDVVFEADGEPVRSAGAFLYAVRGSGVGNDLELRLMRNGAEITIDVPVEKAPKRGD
jgi:S1-C subfamily serine protease